MALDWLVPARLVETIEAYLQQLSAVAIEEAARVSFVYRFKLQGMVDDVPCAACMGARLRDDSAAVRFRGFTLDPLC